MNCDAVVALGSTLSVYPAAAVPLTAARRGVPYAIINNGPTEHDGLPEVTIRHEGNIGEIFPTVVARSRAVRCDRRKTGWALARLHCWCAVACARLGETDGCEFHEGSHSDGDSVEMLRDGKQHIFRLYFVDCVERNPDSRARRAVQARYFGLDEGARLGAESGLPGERVTRDHCANPSPFTRAGNQWMPIAAILPFGPSSRRRRAMTLDSVGGRGIGHHTAWCESGL